MFFTFFKLYKWYQIAQRISYLILQVVDDNKCQTDPIRLMVARDFEWSCNFRTEILKVHQISRCFVHSFLWKMIVTVFTCNFIRNTVRSRKWTNELMCIIVYMHSHVILFAGPIWLRSCNLCSRKWGNQWRTKLMVEAPKVSTTFLDSGGGKNFSFNYFRKKFPS